MQRALPVAVKFLHKGNKELSRNMASYLSLAAMEHANLLTPHVQPIMDSIISGTSVAFNVHFPAVTAYIFKAITLYVEYYQIFMTFRQNLSKDTPWHWFLYYRIVTTRKNWLC